MRLTLDLGLDMRLTQSRTLSDELINDINNISLVITNLQEASVQLTSKYHPKSMQIKVFMLSIKFKS